MHDRAMREFGLSSQQDRAICGSCCSRNPGVSQEDIASFLMIDKGAVAKGIKDMTAKGFLRREAGTRKTSGRYMPVRHGQSLHDMLMRAEKSAKRVGKNDNCRYIGGRNEGVCKDAVKDNERI